MALDVTDLVALVTIQSLEPDVEPNEANIRLALTQLSRDDALFFCARINAIVTGFGAEENHLQRQRQAIQMLCSPAQLRRLNKFAARYGGPDNVKVFFRGQFLELARWLALFGQNDSADSGTFGDPQVRAHFARAAFIASGLWERRLFGIQGLRPGLDPYAQLRAALGPFRKNIEEANPAPHPGFVIYRSWRLFLRYLPQHLPEFGAAFQSRTGLTVQQYFICAFAILPRTFFNHPDGQRLFKSDYVEGDTPFKATFAAFMRLHAQTPEEWAAHLRQAPSEETTDVSLRRHPVLSFSGGRSIILDPTCFIDNLASAPLFFAIQGGLKANRVFGAFGDAVEDYVVNLLQRMYPPDAAQPMERMYRGLEGENALGQRFEIDVSVTDASTVALLEVKAAWIRDDAVLNPDPEQFIAEMRKKYGYTPDGTDRGKGVAQLARSVGALARGEWFGPGREFRGATDLYPVLLVYDRRMASPGTGHFLDTEFKHLLGSVPDNLHVHSVILMTVADLEYVVSALGSQSLLALFRDYSAADPDRVSSFHNFVLRVPPHNTQTVNPMLAELNDELTATTRAELGLNSEPPVS